MMWKLASNGAMTLPSYDFTMPESAGTEPGTLDSARKPIRPIIARRPLLTSALSLVAFCSSDSFLVKPNGSKRLSGAGCTFALNVGK